MVVGEILSTEQSYVRGLRQLNEHFLAPLRASKIVTSDEVARIFGNAEHLLGVNESFLVMLEDRIAKPKEKQPWVRVGDLFLHIGAYALYVNNYTKSLDVLHKTKSNNKLDKFLEGAKAAAGADLMALLITPVQRLPRYELLLREVIRCTVPQSADHKDLTEAIRVIKEVNFYINESKRRAERLHRLLLVSTKVYGLPTLSIFDVSCNRAFMGQGAMKIELRKRSVVRVVILFNDCLLLTRKKASLVRGSCNLSARFAFHYNTMKITIPSDRTLRLEEDGVLATFVAEKGSKRSQKFLDHMKSVIKSASA